MPNVHGKSVIVGSFVTVLGLLVAGCAGIAPRTANGIVRYEGSGELVKDALVTPLVGSRSPTGELVPFATDPNNPATRSDDEGRFALDYSVVAEVPGLQVTVVAPSDDGRVLGRLDWRVEANPAQPGELVIPTPQECTDATDCGTPLLPDLTPVIAWTDVSKEDAERLRPGPDSPVSAGLLPAETWFVTESENRRLLRFATVALNAGAGPLDVIAEQGQTGTIASTWQRIWTDTWHFSDVPSGEFVRHPTHDHIHFDAFERYRLLALDGEVVASAEKVSFCLRDSVRIGPVRPATGAMLIGDDDCGELQQVINPGFGDHYHALLDDQWIDITGVASGTYVVEITIDPENLIVESDEANNVGTFEVVIE